jgi:hypothetical protein
MTQVADPTPLGPSQSCAAVDPTDRPLARHSEAPALSGPTGALRSPALVPRAVSVAKLAAELDDWEANAALYQRRGWLLLARGPLHVDVAFVASVPLIGMYCVPVITACVRIDFTNYDLWAPSVRFIDARTREPAAPTVRAPFMTDAGPRDALVDGHPETGRPFLCLPGIREYHNHPQHTGDDWLLHRVSGAGRLAVICERIWQRMVRTVVGLRVTMQAMPPPIGTNLEVVLAQGNPSGVLPVGPANPGGPTPVAEPPHTDSSESRPAMASGGEATVSKAADAEAGPMFGNTSE